MKEGSSLFRHCNPDSPGHLASPVQTLKTPNGFCRLGMCKIQPVFLRPNMSIAPRLGLGKGKVLRTWLSSNWLWDVEDTKKRKELAVMLSLGWKQIMSLNWNHKGRSKQEKTELKTGWIWEAHLLTEPHTRVLFPKCLMLADQTAVWKSTSLRFNTLKL